MAESWHHTPNFPGAPILLAVHIHIQHRPWLAESLTLWQIHLPLQVKNSNAHQAYKYPQ
jgi:hypothetical protein